MCGMGKNMKLVEPTPKQLMIVSQFFWPEPIGTPLYVTDFARWFAARETKVTVLIGRPYYPNFRLMSGYEAGLRDKEALDKGMREYASSLRCDLRRMFIR